MTFHSVNWLHFYQYIYTYNANMCASAANMNENTLKQTLKMIYKNKHIDRIHSKIDSNTTQIRENKIGNVEQDQVLSLYTNTYTYNMDLPK